MLAGVLLAALSLATLPVATGESPPLVPPAVVELPTLHYPEGAHAGRVEVVVRLLVDERGAVERVDLVSGEEPFASQALAASWKLRFEPGMEAGEAVAMELPFTWVFPEPMGVTPPPLPPTTDHESVGTYSVHADAVVHTLTREDVRAMPGTLGDPVRALVNLPGFARSPLESGWLLVRGSGPGDTGVYLDGVRQPLLFHLGGFTSLLQPELVSEARFSPGSWSSRYGGITAGAVELVPAPPPEEVRLQAGVNLVWSHALAEAPLGKGWGLSLGGRRSYLDGVLGLVLDEASASIAPRFSDMQARVANRRVSMTLLGLSDALETPSGAELSETLVVRQRALQAQGRASLDFGGGELTVAAWLALKEHELDTEASDETESQIKPGGRLTWTSAPGARVGVATGLVAERTTWRLHRDRDQREAPVGRVDPWAELTGGYRGLRGRAGLRVDTLISPGHLLRARPSPHASASLALSERLRATAEVGRSHQSPDLVLLLGMPEGVFLPLERSDTASLGGRWSHSDLAVEGAGWVRHMADLAALERDGSLGRLEGRAYGVEAQVRHRGERGEVRVLVQASRSDRREEPDHPWSPWRYHQDYRLAVLGTRHLRRDLTVSARLRAASGYSLDDRAQSAFDILTQTVVDIETGAGGRLPPWYALDLKLGKRWTWKSFTLDAWLDIQNTTHRRVPEPTINGLDDTIPVYSFGLPILPVFGVEGTWVPVRVARQACP